MRRSGYQAQGIHLGLLYEGYEYFHRGVSLSQPVFSSQEIYKVAYRLLKHSPYRLPVRNVAISCFHLSDRSKIQLELFTNTLIKNKLVEAIDAINEKWGSFVITPAIMANTQDHVHDRISFGQVRDLSLI
jgi:hypothetical protein